jgi:hypothetical protein
MNDADNQVFLHDRLEALMAASFAEELNAGNTIFLKSPRTSRRD